MWLLWLLHDVDRPDFAHSGAWSDNPNNHLQLYVKINRAIGNRLAKIGADAQATDGARHLRIPGSMHTGTEKIVRWTVIGEGHSAHSYTLQELADFFGIHPRNAITIEHKALAKSPSKAKRRGWVQANSNKLAVLTAIRDMRNGFSEGCRQQAVFLFAYALRVNSVALDEARKAGIELGLECRPPLSACDCTSSVRSAYRKDRSWKISYQRIADTLGVTPCEAGEISEFIRKPFPAARSFGELLNTGPITAKRSDLRVQRRERISQIIAENGGTVPTLHPLKARLFELGIETTIETLSADYKALGIQSGTLKKRKIAQAECASQNKLELISARHSQPGCPVSCIKGSTGSFGVVFLYPQSTRRAFHVFAYPAGG